MEISEIISIALGGGLTAALTAIVSMKSTLRKAKADAVKATAEAEKVKAEAETVHLDNTEHATRILVENIVNPLKEELNSTRDDLNGTRKDLQATKREMARLRKSIDTANSCRHRDDCPVLDSLREHTKGGERDGGADGGGERQHDTDSEDCDDRGGPGLRGGADGSGGQPP